MSGKSIMYSDKYYDDKFEYRHVILPREKVGKYKAGVLLSEIQWRNLGICMSRGWVHYESFKPEPNVLLFRRRFRGESERMQFEKKSSMYKMSKVKKKFKK